MVKIRNLILENRTILKIRAGSHLYGLNTANSDKDYIGIYLNSPEELFGLNSSEIIDDSIIEKLENGKNSKNALDCTYYELRKFCRLALNANPTMLEVLFVNNKNIIEQDQYGQELLTHQDLFLSTKIKHSFLGYAFSQKRKSQVKSENLKILHLARETFLNETQNTMLYDFVKKNAGKADFISHDNSFPDYLIIADLKFNNQKIKDVLAKINYRINNAANRADGMLEHGLDYKFISHTLRLLYEGEELLSTGKLEFPLKQSAQLKAIKMGKMKPIDVMEIIEKKERDIEALYEKSVLPHKADHIGVNNLVTTIYKNYLGI